MILGYHPVPGFETRHLHRNGSQAGKYHHILSPIPWRPVFHRPGWLHGPSHQYRCFHGIGGFFSKARSAGQYRFRSLKTSKGQSLSHFWCNLRFLEDNWDWMHLCRYLQARIRLPLRPADLYRLSGSVLHEMARHPSGHPSFQGPLWRPRPPPEDPHGADCSGYG